MTTDDVIEWIPTVVILVWLEGTIASYAVLTTFVNVPRRGEDGVERKTPPTPFIALNVSLLWPWCLVQCLRGRRMW